MKKLIISLCLALVACSSVKSPKVLYKVAPVYPVEAKAANFSGNVLIEVVLNEYGDITRATAKTSQPYGLTDSALKAVWQYKFSPGKLDGHNVPSVIMVTVKFRRS